MVIDTFTKISAERFRNIEAQECGNAVIAFPYRNYNPEYPESTLGLWLSTQLVKRRVEAAHYIPDYECTRALEVSGAYSANGLVWLGLFVEVDGDSVANLTLPQFVLDDYERLAIDKKTPLKAELEERFCMQINTD